ncbi:MAG: GMP/IMP nucleotidase [Gammaproteobacteria bacterium]|nr:MAG: GMP/IMP nucleotidase [Gammaproteobacteria bacterium]
MIHWHDIHSIFLDMDGTLLDLYFDNHFWREHVPRCYAKHHDLDIETAKSHLYPRYRDKEGTMDWYCVEYWTRELGLDIVALKQEVDHLIAVHEHVIEFLDFTRRSGIRTVLLTNAHSKTLALKMARTGLEQHFDALICAHDIGYPKEDPRFWPRLDDHESFRRESTLFVDDSLPVLRAAHAYGISHLLAIRRPDSQSPPREVTEFPSIDSFREITPET